MPEITDNPDLPDESDLEEPTQYAPEPDQGDAQDDDEEVAP